MLLNRRDIATAITSTSVPSTDPILVAATEAEIARSPLLAQQVVAAAEVGRTSAELLANSIVSLSGADVLGSPSYESSGGCRAACQDIYE